MEFQQVEYSLAHLEAELARLRAALGTGPYATDIDIKRNRVLVQVLSEGSFIDFAQDRGFDLPPEAEVQEVASLPTPALNLYGGRALDSGGNVECTSGFTVWEINTSTRRITAAAHCDDQLTLFGNALTFVAMAWGGSHDEQMHRYVGGDFKNWINDGSGTREIHSKQGRSQQNVGDYVCHYGRITGYGCGFIVGKNSVPCSGGPDPDSTAIKVDSDPNGTGFDLAEGGDSGGPWFIADVALGTMSCQQGFDAIYVGINYVENGLGANLLTAP